MNQVTDQKKSLIVETAFSILKTRGLQTLSFSEIENDSGISRQLVRYYFPTMDDLMIAVCNFLANLYRSSLVSGVAKRAGSERFNFFMDFYFDLLDDPRKPRDDQVYDACFAYAAGSPAIRNNLRTQYELIGQVISNEIQVQFPTLNEEDAKELSFLFVVLMYGHWKMVASLGYSDEHQHITRSAIDRLVASYVDSGNLSAD